MAPATKVSAAGNGLSPPVESVPERRGGELTLIRIEPAAGSALSEGSSLHVVIDYRIFRMDRTAHYGIMPVFGDKDGKGGGFVTGETLDGMGELRSSAGRAELNVPVRAAWRDARFGRPPSISFHLVMQYPERGIDAIAEVGPFSFE